MASWSIIRSGCDAKTPDLASTILDAFVALFGALEFLTELLVLAQA